VRWGWWRRLARRESGFPPGAEAAAGSIEDGPYARRRAFPITSLKPYIVLARRGTMDSPNDHRPENETHDESPQVSEASIRAMLEQSRQDIAEGRTVPLAPVLDRMRATAERIRHERSRTTGADRRHA